MKRKAIALLLSFTMLSLSTTAYAADTVQNAPTINSSGKLVIDNTGITIDSKDLTDLASVINNNATILTNVKDLSKQNETNIATDSDEYSSSKTYKQGGLCIKDGSIYQCTADIDTAEAWNASHWEKVSLSSTINSLNININNMQTSFQDGINTIVTAVNSKAGTSLNGTNTPEEIAEAINGLGNSGSGTSGDGINIWSSGAFKFVSSSGMVLNRGTYGHVENIYGDPLTKFYEYHPSNDISVENTSNLEIVKSKSTIYDFTFTDDYGPKTEYGSSLEIKIPEGIITGAGYIKAEITYDSLENWNNATPRSIAYGLIHVDTGTASDGAVFSNYKRLEDVYAKYGQEGKYSCRMTVDRATDILRVNFSGGKHTRENYDIHPSVKNIEITFIPKENYDFLL